MRGLMIFAVVWVTLITLWMLSKRVVEDKKQAYTDGEVTAVIKELKNNKYDTVSFGESNYPDSFYFVDKKMYPYICVKDYGSHHNVCWGPGEFKNSCTLFCYLKAETLIIVNDTILERGPKKKPTIIIDPDHGGAAILYDKNGKRIN